MARLSPPALLRVVAVLALGLGSACYTGVPSASDDVDTGTGGDTPDARCEDEPLAPLPNLVRLTHRQYDNTIRDLVGLDDAPSDVFLPDAKIGGFDNNAELLAVGDRLARDYRRSAEDIAGELVADPALFDALVPCDAADPGCPAELVATFGRRAFRRPLTDGEQARYVALFAAADGLYESGTAFEQGVRVVVESMLQSPNVLYRVELSSPPDDEDIVPLGGFEIAARLSYLLWNSTPDDALLDAAEAGELDTAAGVAEQARRLLADDRARDPVADFHAQWLQVEKYLDLSKDPELFPQWGPTLGDALQEETRRFIERVVFEEEGGFRELMTSPVSVVDAQLAEIYGVAAPTDGGADGFGVVELDPSTRAGLLTQVGFLASRAYADVTSPIHRGVFVQRQILCNPLPDPPPNIDPNLPPLEGDIHTTRDAVEVHTSPEQCVACHGLINEPGFALEGYDAIGRVRTEENGWPLDTKVLMSIDEVDVELDGGVALANALADSAAAQRCYVRQWFRYASMRQETPDDACTIDALHESLVADDVRHPMSASELMVALTQTRTFRYRGAAR